MGNSQGTSEVETVGFRILGVQPNSPAEKVGLVSFFDFIVAVNGVPLRNLEVSFIEIIKVSLLIIFVSIGSSNIILVY